MIVMMRWRHYKQRHAPYQATRPHPQRAEPTRRLPLKPAGGRVDIKKEIIIIIIIMVIIIIKIIMSIIIMVTTITMLMIMIIKFIIMIIIIVIIIMIIIIIIIIMIIIIIIIIIIMIMITNLRQNTNEHTHTHTHTHTHRVTSCPSPLFSPFHFTQLTTFSSLFCLFPNKSCSAPFSPSSLIFNQRSLSLSLSLSMIFSRHCFLFYLFLLIYTIALFHHMFSPITCLPQHIPHSLN